MSDPDEFVMTEYGLLDPNGSEGIRRIPEPDADSRTSIYALGGVIVSRRVTTWRVDHG